MPIKFSFKRRLDNKLIPIDDIDKQLNKDLKKIYIETDEYSQTLIIVTMIGDLCLKNNNNNNWDEKYFRKIIKELSFNEDEIIIIRKYLYDEYIYNSWR